MAEITLQLRHGWRRSLVTLILFTEQPGFLCCELIQLPWLRWVCHTAYFYFLTIRALEGCLASFHFQSSDESHRHCQGSGAGDLWGPTLYHVSGHWRVSSNQKEPTVSRGFHFADEGHVTTECDIDLPVTHLQGRACSH